MNVYEARDIEMGRIDKFNEKLAEISKEGWAIVGVINHTSKFKDLSQNVTMTQYARVFLEKKASKSGGAQQQRLINE
jgi:hypothetical protein